MALLSDAKSVFLVILIGLGLGVGLRFFASSSSEARQVGYRARALPSGPEIVLMYFGTRSCSYSAAEATVESVRTAKSLVEARAKAIGLGFVSHGVASDWDVRGGMSHLERSGPWDEVSLGRSWANSVVLEYLFEDASQLAGTPKIVILRRTLDIGFGPDSVVTRYGFRDEQVLLRVNGAEEIGGWVEEGAPVPGIDLRHSDA